MNDREAMICRLKEIIYGYYGHKLCTLGTLVRIDECVHSCTNCIFKDTDKFVHFLGCPYNWGCTFGTYKSMVK